jgi:MFS family permease
MFRAIWLATLMSNLGVWIQSVVAAWLMTSITDSAPMVALVQSATALPVLMFSLFGGALADLWDRRLVFMTGQIIVLSGATLIAVLQGVGAVTPWLLLALVFVLDSGSALRLPANNAPDLSPITALPRPTLAPGVDVGPGAVAVTVEYDVEPANAAAFSSAMRRLRRLRRRDGAVRWTLYQDAANPSRWVEAFVLRSWLDDLRHQRRTTMADRGMTGRQDGSQAA